MIAGTRENGSPCPTPLVAGKVGAERSPVFDNVGGVSLEIEPSISKRGRKTSMRDKLSGELGVEGVVGLVVIVADHGRIQTMEEGMFQVTLRIPGCFHGLSACNATAATAEVRMSDGGKPRLHHVEPRARLDAVHG